MSEQTRRLLILGCSGLALEIAEIAEQSGGYEVAGFVQDLWPERRGERLEGYPVYFLEDVRDWHKDHWAVCGTGLRERIDFIRRVEALGFSFATLVHRAAVVSPRAGLGEGCVVAAGAVIGTRVRLGRHVMVSRNASVGHDTEVEDYAFIGPGASVAGVCKIGRGAFLGIGAAVRDHLKIGPGAVVGAGACALQDLPPGVLLSAPRAALLE
ncbi:MAG: acetyltransferase [Bryobacteraceae bacterium]|nr:acetyltransferase [Bryobacteraceae bacterium]